ncbi:hypothetical protein [Cupriavidus oxalaticus]|uniref:Uncharacterized protein n=1 Tax=Cupriavidus oxalaticus TaxID=96344 RepID=A0A4P7LIT7_9BURK|nr:hypothetical protein [Cupriavidus oxalaticus]QBY56134.1 hypothetical protein E0W60_34310 [Cupriavidus oxalaticus]
MDDKVMIPWARVATLLARAGRRQTWLAKQLNVSSNVVVNWKSRGVVPAGRATSVARAFGVTVEALMAAQLEAPKMSQAGVRLVQRLGELDRSGLLTKQTEGALMAFLDLVESVASGAQTKGRT